ncbi:hypothetical protein T05_507 [Trichinella murrelli]|uniref:Uncharacterized protein n=1 Tax=Trichinella murrelli TaxID=144512 RepID=A0A0V0T648_9BILA|nr:hypothetical protein T05_507 [Trichinella murrelli]
MSLMCTQGLPRWASFRGTIARRLHNVSSQHFDQEGFQLRSLVVGDQPWGAPHWLGVSGVNDAVLHARPPEFQI